MAKYKKKLDSFDAYQYTGVPGDPGFPPDITTGKIVFSTDADKYCFIQEASDIPRAIVVKKYDYIRVWGDGTVKRLEVIDKSAFESDFELKNGESLKG